MLPPLLTLRFLPPTIWIHDAGEEFLPTVLGFSWDFSLQECQSKTRCFSCLPNIPTISTFVLLWTRSQKELCSCIRTLNPSLSQIGSFVTPAITLSLKHLAKKKKPSGNQRARSVRPSSLTSNGWIKKCPPPPHTRLVGSFSV